MARYPKAERAKGYLLAKDLDDEPVDEAVRLLPLEEVIDVDLTRRRDEPAVRPGTLFDL